MQIIAFGHRRRVGKDTVSNFTLINFRLKHTHKSCIRSSFAGNLKDEAFRLFSWSGLREGIWYENHPEDKETILPTIGKSPRQIWIELGEAIRGISKKTWPELMLKDVEQDFLIVSDLRHIVELEYIRLTGGFAIKVIRPGIPESDDNVDSALKDCDAWDGQIINNGSLKDLNILIKEKVVPAILNNVRGWTFESRIN